MFRKPEDAPQIKTTINCLIAEAGLGDLLCSLPALNYIQTKCTWINLLIWCPDFLVPFFKHVLPKDSIIRGFTEAKTKYDNTKYAISTKWEVQGVKRTTPMSTHPVLYSYGVLCDYFPTLEEMSYPKIKPELIDVSKFNLPEKYVILPAASTEFVKTIPKETIDKLSDYVISKGYTPIFLGKTENNTGYEDMNYHAEAQDYDFSKGINLLDETTVLESAGIIANAKLFLGIDSGLSHLAGFTSTPVVCYYSFVKSRQQVPTRDGVTSKDWYAIDTNLNCGGCQTRMTLLQHDFRKCFYDDYQCISVEQCNALKFIDIIERNNLL